MGKMKIINVDDTTKMMSLYENDAPVIIKAEGQPPLIVSPCDEGRDMLIARILAGDDSLDDTLKRLELIAEGNGSTEVWDELDV